MEQFNESLQPGNTRNTMLSLPCSNATDIKSRLSGTVAQQIVPEKGSLVGHTPSTPSEREDGLGWALRAKNRKFLSTEVRI